MARIAGVDLPRDKRVEIGLTYIYGIGRTSAERILEERSSSTSRDLKRSDATVESVIEKDFRYVDRRLRLMQEHAKVLREL